MSISELCVTEPIRVSEVHKSEIWDQDISNQLTPLSSSFSHENKGGSIAWGKLDFQKSYFLSKLKQDLLQNGKIFAGSRRIFPTSNLKRIRRFAANFYV